VAFALSDTYGVVIAKDVMVPMRDGVRLAADIYRPAQNGEAAAGHWPTILARTSYDKSAQRYVDSIPNFFTPRGYAVVLQDLRGRYRSEGFGEYFHTANVREGVDGFDPRHPVPTVGGAVTAFFEMAPMPHLDPFWGGVKYMPPWVRMRNIVTDGPVDQRTSTRTASP